mgnify:CR=1 FL=1
MLFRSLWIPDLFMKRVEANGSWSLFCPAECPGLVDSWGAEFEALYEKYEAEGKAREQLSAQQLWFAILDSQIETVTKVCDVAGKEFAIEQAMDKMEGEWKGVNLEIVAYRETGTYVLKGFDVVQQLLAQLRHLPSGVVERLVHLS